MILLWLILLYLVDPSILFIILFNFIDLFIQFIFISNLTNFFLMFNLFFFYDLLCTKSKKMFFPLFPIGNKKLSLFIYLHTEFMNAFCIFYNVITYLVENRNVLSPKVNHNINYSISFYFYFISLFVFSLFRRLRF